MYPKINKKDKKELIWIDSFRQQSLQRNMPYFLKKIKKRNQSIRGMNILIIIKKIRIKTFIRICYKLKFLVKVLLTKMINLINGTVQLHQVKRRKIRFLNSTLPKNRKKELLKGSKLGLLIYSI